MKIGNDNISKIYLGTEEVQKIYLGDTLVYGEEPVPTPSLTAGVRGMTKTNNDTQVYSTEGDSYYVCRTDNFTNATRILTMRATGSPTNTSQDTQYSCGYIELPYTTGQIIHGGKNLRQWQNYNAPNNIIFGKYNNGEFVPIITGLGMVDSTNAYTNYCINTGTTLTYSAGYNSGYNFTIKDTQSVNASAETTTDVDPNTLPAESERTFGNLAQLIYDDTSDHGMLLYTVTDKLVNVIISPTVINDITHVRILPTYTLGVNASYPISLSEIGVYYDSYNPGYPVMIHDLAYWTPDMGDFDAMMGPNEITDFDFGEVNTLYPDNTGENIIFKAGQSYRKLNIDSNREVLSEGLFTPTVDTSVPYYGMRTTSGTNVWLIEYDQGSYIDRYVTDDSSYSAYTTLGTCYATGDSYDSPVDRLELN